MAAGRRKSGRIFLFIALFLIIILGAVAFLLRDQLIAQPFVAQPLLTPMEPQETVDILVLAQPIVRGGMITENVLAKVAYPKKELVAGLFFTEIQEVVGKRTKYDLPQGFPLTPNMVTDAPTGSYAAFSIPRGMVAISIPISRLTSVSYAIQPGDRVNVIASLMLVDLDTQFQTRLPNFSASVVAPGPVMDGAGNVLSTTLTVSIHPDPGGILGRPEFDSTLNQAVYAVPSEEQRPRLVSQTLLQDVMVLWVGDFPEGGQIAEALTTPTPEPGVQQPLQQPEQILPPDQPEQLLPPDQPEQPGAKDLISLIVTPQDAVALNYLMLSGAKLNLVLRSTGDDQRIPTEAVTLQFILDQYNIPIPAKLPYGIQPRVDELIFPE